MKTERTGKLGECDIAEDKWRKNLRKERLITSAESLWKLKKDKDQETVIDWDKVGHCELWQMQLH